MVDLANWVLLSLEVLIQDLAPEGQGVHVIGTDGMCFALFDELNALGLGLARGQYGWDAKELEHLDGVIAHRNRDLHRSNLELVGHFHVPSLLGLLKFLLGVLLDLLPLRNLIASDIEATL